MKWWDIIKFCGIPEREREPFHPNDPPMPYAEDEENEDDLV